MRIASEGEKQKDTEAVMTDTTITRNTTEQEDINHMALRTHATTNVAMSLSKDGNINSSKIWRTQKDKM